MKRAILITIDTLRPDHLGCYGYLRPTSPVMDRLAREGIVYENAFSAISYTAPSVVSMFTSRYPSFHYMGFDNGTTELPANPEMMLPEILHQEGINTAAFVSTIVLSRELTGLNRGFAVYDDIMSESELNRKEILLRRGEKTTDRALKWLEKSYDTPFFLWIHYMDVHGPYTPPEPFKKLFRRRRFFKDPYWKKEGVVLDRIIETPGYFDTVPEGYKPGIFSYQVLNKRLDREGNVVDFEKDVHYYISQYDGAIRYVDDQVGRIITFLKEKKIYDDSLFIITSDHGEAFGENDVYFFHGLTVSLDQIRVPLLIKCPGVLANRVSSPVSLIDIMPTILNYFSLKYFYDGFQGVSLLSDTVKKERLIVSQIVRQLSLISESHQVLYGRGWFDRGFGRIFGDEVDERYLRLEGSIKCISLHTGKENNLDSKIDCKQIQDYIIKAKDEKRDYLRSSVSRETMEIKARLHGLGYVD